MARLELDFVVYLGDPDEGGEAVSSADALARVGELVETLNFPDVYGALTITREGEELIERKPDPVFGLITNLVRTVPFIIEGEPERSLLSESEHGLSIEPSVEEVLVSFFAGDPYEPDEYLLHREAMPLTDFGEDVLSMGERLRDLIKAVSPDHLEDDYSQSLIEFLDMGRDALKTYKLEVERGVRVL